MYKFMGGSQAVCAGTGGLFPRIGSATGYRPEFLGKNIRRKKKEEIRGKSP
jgi:hypothetical protein